jgi:hypothetical protein
LHSWRIDGPPARWIAPSTPPPPIRDEYWVHSEKPEEFEQLLHELID